MQLLAEVALVNVSRMQLGRMRFLDHVAIVEGTDLFQYQFIKSHDLSCPMQASADQSRRFLVIL